MEQWRLAVGIWHGLRRERIWRHGKGVRCAPEEERPGDPEGSQGWSVIDAPLTRLSLVGLRPRNPDSVSPSESKDTQGKGMSSRNQGKHEEKYLMKQL